MYDKSWFLKFVRWPCKNINYWHTTNSDITSFWFGRERIKCCPFGKKLSQVYSKDESEPESIIVDESSTEDSESESVHKSINKNKEKYAIDETEYEESSVTDNPVINEPRYFNLFKCGKNIVNRLDATWKQACMVTSRDRYYMEIFNTPTD